MIALARQVGTSRLDARHWRVALEVAGGVRIAAAGEPVSVRRVEGTSPRARVETISAPRLDTPGTWEAVLALDEPVVPGTRAVYELGSGGEWGARVELEPDVEEPTPRRRAASTAHPRADVDYRARDFDALRAMMLRVIGEHVAAPLADHPVAQTTAIVEELAYLGDALSYQQDALATEAYLATARLRTSVARHAALLDYEVFEGRSARAWVRFEVSEPLVLPAGTAVRAEAAAFETLQDVALEPGARRLPLARDARLAVGATRATVRGTAAGLERGALALLEPRTPALEGVGHVVRLASVETARDETGGELTEIEWLPADAVPDDALVAGLPACVRVGNLVLVEEGEWQPWAPLPKPVAGRPYRPLLPHRHTAFSPPPARRASAESAAEALVPEPRTTRPGVRLREQIGPARREWDLRASLFASGPMATDFVVEVGEEGRAGLRFGDDVNGLAPPPGAAFEVRQRTGKGRAGNVGAEEIVALVTPDERITRVTNPSAARGGAGPEPLERARLTAPEAFRQTDRLVSPADYAEQALRIDGVEDAVATLASTGSWPIAVVHVHTGRWSLLDEPVIDRVRARLAELQPAGVALQVRRASGLPVAVELDISLVDGWAERAVAAALDRAIRREFLRPGRFRLGQPLHASEVLTTVAAVPGVTNATLKTFDWYGGRPGRARGATLLPPFGHSIRVDNDSGRPQHGYIAYAIRRPA